ncbi:MAG: TIM44-like domain-containing protein [Syntrophomonas sp.]
MFSLRRFSKGLLLCMACMVLCTFAYVHVVDAAVGHSTSHSSSSSSSGSKSSSSSSSKSSSSSSSTSSSGYTSGGSSVGGFFAALFIIPFVIIVIIIILVIMFIKRKGGGMPEMPVQQESAAVAVGKDPAYLRQALAELRERDPNFSEDMFISRINNMFVQLQEAWQAKDWKKVRPFESDELFNTHARQLQELIDSHTTNVVDEIAILRTEISDYHDNGATETLDVYMRCRYKDYIVDDNTGKVVEGDPNREYFMEYELAMSRKKGVTTRLAQNTVVSTCPNCGANVSINASGECEYCNSVVSNGDFDWVLTRMDVLSQN